MNGLLLASHVKALSDALAILVRQLCGADLTIVSIGGQEELGVSISMVTDAMIELQNQGVNQVVALGDLGSALIALEAAQDLLPESMTLYVADAPLVEGAVAAAMALTTGQDAKEATEMAQEARGISKK